MSVKILNSLKTERLGNQLWRVFDDFRVEIDGELIIVPKGFVTNGASVPRALWWICAPIAGPFGEGAVVHDWMYNRRSIWMDKGFADRVLYIIGRHRGANWFRAHAVWAAVQGFGRWHWKRGD